VVAHAHQVKRLLSSPLPRREGLGEGEHNQEHRFHPHLASPVKGEKQHYTCGFGLNLMCMGEGEWWRHHVTPFHPHLTSPIKGEEQRGIRNMGLKLIRMEGNLVKW